MENRLIFNSISKENKYVKDVLKSMFNKVINLVVTKNRQLLKIEVTKNKIGFLTVLKGSREFSDLLWSGLTTLRSVTDLRYGP